MLFFPSIPSYFDLFLYFCRVNRKKKLILCLGTNVEQQRNMQAPRQQQERGNAYRAGHAVGRAARAAQVHLPA